MSTTESSPQPDDLLLFAPVASAYRGANGWTAEVQRAFVDALARTGVIAAAARSVGRSRESAHRLRRRAGEDSGFARAWDQAQARAGRVALAHAVDGVGAPRRVEVWYRGRHVGWRTYTTTGSRWRRCERSTGRRHAGQPPGSTQQSC
jgi:hypothetical protein